MLGAHLVTFATTSKFSASDVSISRAEPARHLRLPLRNDDMHHDRGQGGHDLVTMHQNPGQSSTISSGTWMIAGELAHPVRSVTGRRKCLSSRTLIDKAGETSTYLSP
ncbi:hypothetical protein OBBRIDRAFT_252883 [Obba rivulosa]|uniref:Uncharacterized protein n=1 Tax=Obba rivulosa TaxID=1052685 RepID=A0A8E2DQJ5_9APHY|nr:hypothetical protein OBBRIDRAFT_252883 [Obba rivulosa]